MFGFRIVFVVLAICSKNAICAEFYDIVNDDSDYKFFDDIAKLIRRIVWESEPKSVGIIFDSIFKQHLNSKSIDFLDSKSIFTVTFKDSESFAAEPSKEIESMLKAMKDSKIELFVVLIVNGVQMKDFLKHAEYHRVINVRAKLLTLHDYRLFTPDMHFLWRRLVNVVFIRMRNINGSEMFELSTVPFPARIKEVFVARIINYWTPLKRFRWKRKTFADKISQKMDHNELNVAVLQHTPAVYKKDGQDEFFGMEIDLIETLSSVMKFSLNYYEPFDVDSEKWGRQVGERNFTGLLREMDEAQADIAIGNLHLTPLNLKIMDLSVPYNTECLTFITPEVLSDNSWKTLILPFSLGMWVGVLISLGFIGIIFFVFSKIVKNSNEKLAKGGNDIFGSFSDSILYTYSMILLVSLPRLPPRWSGRVLTGWWWIYCVLVVVAYRASLTSILANPTPRLTIDTLEVLAKSNLKCGTSAEQNVQLFTLSSDEAAQKIGLKMKQVDDEKEAIDRVASGSFAYFENQYTLQQLRFNHEKRASEFSQSLHIMDQCVINIPVSIGLDKNSPFKDQIDKHTRRLIEGGLVQLWLMKAVKSFESSIEPPPKEALMDLKKFYGALFALGCGYALALTAFLIEKTYWKFSARPRSNYLKL